MNSDKAKEETSNQEWIELNTLVRHDKKQQTAGIGHHLSEKDPQHFDAKKTAKGIQSEEEAHKDMNLPVNVNMARRRNMIYHQKASRIPTMKVTCSRCGEHQSISATKNGYTCVKCGQKEQCQGLYGVIGCLKCEKKIMYMKGLAKQVRCTNCREINECKESQFAIVLD